MSAVLAASKNSDCAESYTTNDLSNEFEKGLAIDLGDDQRKAVVALIEARSAMRKEGRQEQSESLLSRASLLFGKTGKPTNLADMVDRSSSLMSLRRTGYTPEDFIQYGPQMTYKRLSNAYNVKDLVQFGFTFEHFCQLGFDSDDLRHFESGHYRLLGLDAAKILTKVPLTALDLISLKLEPHFLRELRFTFSHFVNDLCMTQSQLAELMPPRDLQMYFRPTSADMAKLQRTADRAKSRELKKSNATAAAWTANNAGPLNF